VTAGHGADEGSAQGASLGADLVAGLVERAALDGSTCLPAAVLAAALRGEGIESPGPSAEAAVEAGRVTAYLDERLFGHPTWAPLEEQVAESVVELMTRGGPEALRVVVAPRGSTAPPATEDTSAGAVVVDTAHRLGLADAAELLARLTATGGAARLVLVGDPAMPYAAGPGRVLADLVDSAVVPVEEAKVQDDGQLVSLVRSLRAGDLPAVDPTQREVVVTPASDAQQAVRRAVQLVTSSVPRVFGVPAAGTLVLAPRPDGRAGAGALRAALDEAGAPDVVVATTAEAAHSSADAVVLVLAAESAGSLHRDMLVGAATGAGRHLSVVHQAGPALAEAVTRRPHPPRLTRLAALLRLALG